MRNLQTFLLLQNPTQDHIWFENRLRNTIRKLMQQTSLVSRPFRAPGDAWLCVLGRQQDQLVSNKKLPSSRRQASRNAQPSQSEVSKILKTRIFPPETLSKIGLHEQTRMGAARTTHVWRRAVFESKLTTYFRTKIQYVTVLQITTLSTSGSTTIEVRKYFRTLEIKYLRTFVRR